MRLFATIYKCSNCQSLIQGVEYLSGNTINGISYSDTYTKASMKMPEGAGYIGCANCKKVFALSELEIVKQYKEEEFNKEEYETAIRPLPYFEMLKIMLEDPKFINEHKKSITLWYLWYFNHDLKPEEKKGEIENGNYKKYTDELIGVLDSENNNENSQVLKAEVLRERGEFDKAQDVLDSVDSSKFTTKKISYVFEEMKNKITQKDSAVFESEKKPDFIR
jgi:DNA-directed RNA polymerase subunit RPC12/RpoP